MTGRRGEQVSGFLWAVLLLVGLPVGLAHFVGWPLPHHWPTRAVWELWLKDRLVDRRTLTDLFAIVVWLIWAVLLYTFLADVAARVRRATRRLWRLVRRLRPFPPARDVLGAAVVGTGTAAVSVVATAHPPVLAAATPTATSSACSGGGRPPPVLDGARQRWRWGEVAAPGWEQDLPQGGLGVAGEVGGQVVAGSSRRGPGRGGLGVPLVHQAGPGAATGRLDVWDRTAVSGVRAPARSGSILWRCPGHGNVRGDEPSDLVAALAL